MYKLHACSMQVMCWYVKDLKSFSPKVESAQTGSSSSELSSPSHSAATPNYPSPGGAAPTRKVQQDHSWQKYADSAQIDEDGLRELYVGALVETKYDTAELQDVHLLADKMQPSLDPRSPKVRAILRDMKQMEESLPVHPDSAIFIRQVRNFVASTHFKLQCNL